MFWWLDDFNSYKICREYFSLELVFKNAEGDTKVITVTDPREGITAQEADEAMDIILAANVIETSGGDLVEAVEARLRITQVTVLQ